MHREKGERFQAWNQCFVQMMMSRGFLTGQDMFRSVKSICEQYKGHQRFPKVDTEEKSEIADMIDDFIRLANEKLEPLQMHIVKGMDEVKGLKSDFPNYQQVYVMAPMYENESLAKLQKQYTEPELEWLRLVADYIIVDTDDKMAKEIDCINLCLKGGDNSAKKKLQQNEAEKTLAMFLEEGYLCRVPRGEGRKKAYRISLGTRFLLELESWLDKTYDMDKCEQCQKTVLIYVQCTKPNCNARYHRPCVDKQNRDPKCKNCKTPLKIEGVATKRN